MRRLMLLISLCLLSISGAASASPAATVTDFPRIDIRQLPNGVRLIVLPTPGAKTLQMRLQFDAGIAAEPHAVASLVGDLLLSGTSNGTRSQIDADIVQNGMVFGAGTGLDTTYITLTSPAGDVNWSLALLADIAEHASFPLPELDQVRTERIQMLEADQDDLAAIAHRVLPLLLYGPSHGYSSFDGVGDVSTLRGVTREDLIEFRRTWLRPDNAILVVSGDVDSSTVQISAERAFASWRNPPGPSPIREIGAPPVPTGTRVWLVDVPGAGATYLMGGATGRSYAERPVAAAVASSILSERFRGLEMSDDRVIADLGLHVAGTRGPRPVLFRPTTNSEDVGLTLASLVEALNEFGSNPISAAELRRTVESQLAENSALSTRVDVLPGALAASAAFGLPGDFVAMVPELLRQLSLAEVQETSAEMFAADIIQWVIVGDRARLEPELRAQGIAFEIYCEPSY